MKTLFAILCLLMLFGCQQHKEITVVAKVETNGTWTATVPLTQDTETVIINVNVSDKNKMQYRYQAKGKR